MFVPEKIANLTKSAIARQPENPVPRFKPGQGVTLFERPGTFLRYSTTTPAAKWTPAVGAAMARAQVVLNTTMTPNVAEVMAAIARAARKVAA